MRWFLHLAAKTSRRHLRNARLPAKTRFRRLILEHFEDRRMLAVAVADVFYFVQGATSLDADACSNDQFVNSWDSGWGTEYASFNMWGASYGSISGHPCAFTYTPNGTPQVDGISYGIWDNGDPGYATITILVNSSPVAYADAYSVFPDTLLSSPSSVLNNDNDYDFNTLTAELVADTVHGTLSLAADGNFFYQPNAGYTGWDMFIYQAFDGYGYSDFTSVSIKVDAPPIATDDAYTVAQDTPLTVDTPGVLANDTDPNDDLLLALEFSQPSFGTLELLSNGYFVYTPTPGFSGNDSFTYGAFDGPNFSNVATVSLTIVPADQSLVANTDSYSTIAGQSIVDYTNGVLDNDQFPQGQRAL
jgi:Bacterial Ig domain